MAKRKPRKYHQSNVRRPVSDRAVVWELIQKARLGDQVAFETLLRMHKWVRESMAVKLSRCFPEIDIDDAMQASNIGFWNAVQDYDPKFGSALSSHAVFRIMTQQNHLKAKVRPRDDKDCQLPPDLMQPQPGEKKGMTTSQKAAYRKALEIIARMSPWRIAALRNEFDLNLPVIDANLHDSDQQERLCKEAIIQLKRAFGMMPKKIKKKPQP